MDVVERGRQRREADPDRVRRAEVGDDAALDERRVRRRASGWRIATWAPRLAGSRGEPIEQPSGASHASARAIAYSVRAMPFARIAAMPASATSSMPAWAAVSPRIDGVPTSQPPMPGWRSKRRAHLELVALREPALDRRSQLVLELAPDVQERRAPRGRRSGTCTCSRPRGRRRSPRDRPGSSPPACDRSHRTSAPASRAASVTALMSTIAADR